MRSISVLFNEPKLLKSVLPPAPDDTLPDFSALQRAEIAEMLAVRAVVAAVGQISVLFNEPKLLKCSRC